MRIFAKNLHVYVTFGQKSTYVCDFWPKIRVCMRILAKTYAYREDSGKTQAKYQTNKRGVSMDEHNIKCNTETRRNNEKVNNIKYIVPIENPQRTTTRNSLAESPMLLQREIPMAWGTTIDSLTSEIILSYMQDKPNN